MRTACVAGLTLLVSLGTADGLAGQDPADAAWRSGEIETARRLYAERLAADSSDDRALHRMGLMLAWNEQYDEGIALFDRLLRASPQNIEARLDRAKILLWANRFPDAFQAYDAALDQYPESRLVLLGLAQALSWDDDLDSARGIYERLLARDSADLQALQGMARITGWGGDLIGAESQWHRALQFNATDPVTLVGLSQVLRWQNRGAAAHEMLERVPPERRGTREVTDERRAVAVAIDPRVAPSLIVELDSDDNSIATLLVRSAFRPMLRFEVGIDAYGRTASQPTRVTSSRRAWGALVGGRLFVEPGWSMSAGVGAAGSNGAAAETEPTVRFGITSPRRNHVVGAVAFERSVLDATALLIDSGVTYALGTLSLRAQPSPLWLADVSGSIAQFNGTESNRRIGGFAVVTRRLARPWATALRLRVFGFREGNLLDGLFDPDFYGHGEAILRWQPSRRHWRFEAAVAPGLEQVGSGGSLHATIRLFARSTYEVFPGREVGVSALYSNAGLQSFATGETGYRYLALTASGTWVF